MKKITILITIVLIASTIAGCLYSGNRYDLYQMTRCNVLAANGVGESERVDIEVIEEDTYGRTLYSYTMNVEGRYEGYGRIWVVAICQKSDRKLTYYYEDKCFILSDTLDSISEADIDSLKLNNDWDNPINEEKLSCRPIRPDYIEYIRLGVTDIFNHEMDVEDGAKLSERFTDYDGEGKILYYVIKYDADDYDDIDIVTRLYFMIINEDGSYNKDTFVEEIEDLYNYQEQLHIFKINNDWNFSSK